jgi:hypothetical protein
MSLKYDIDVLLYVIEILYDLVKVVVLKYGI